MSTTFFPPNLGRGRDCPLDDDILDNPSFSPRIDGDHDFDTSIRKVAETLRTGQPVSFKYGCLTAFTVMISSKGRKVGRDGTYSIQLTVAVGSRSSHTTDVLVGAITPQSIAKPLHLLADDARAIRYLIDALGDAIYAIQ